MFVGFIIWMVKELGLGVWLVIEFVSVFGFFLLVLKKGLKNFEIVIVCVGLYCFFGLNVSLMRRYCKCVIFG